MRSFIEQTVAELRERIGEQPRHLRPVRRRRFVGDGGAARQGGRAAGGVHLRRQRPAAAGRGGGGAAARSATISRPTCTSSMPRDRFLQALAGVTDPQEKRQDHRPRLHRRVQGRGPAHRGRALPGPGDALPRRDRERRRGGRPGGEHQDAPQRRRPADGARLRADRAAARTCSRTRCAGSAWNWACRRRWSGGIRSPAPAWRCAASGAVTRDAAGGAAPGRRDPAGGAEAGGLVSQDGPGVRGAAAGAVGRRDGRRPDLRERRSPCGRCRRTTS